MVECTERIFQFINRFKICIMVFWTTLAVISCFYGLDLPNQTVFQFLPPSGSESDIAYSEVNKYFPELLFVDTEVILICAKWSINPNHTILNTDTFDIFTRINDSIWNNVNPHYNLLMDIESYYTTSNITNMSINIHGVDINVQSYINTATQQKYISDTKDVMTLFIQSNIIGASTATLNGFIDSIKHELTAINSDYSDYYIVLTGGITIFQQSMQTITDDITSKDLFIMPIIFTFMIYMIGSWKLVVLPGAALGMTIAISFGIFYPFAIYYLEVNPMAPSIMMFLSMALSIDYSMFLLSRFAEERNKGKSVEDAVRAMLRYSGHVVCLSGCVLIVCYQSLVIFPVSGMQTVGYAAAVAILICILINISLTSAAILQFPNYYGTLEAFPSCLIRCCAKICNLQNKYKQYGLNINANHHRLLSIQSESHNEQKPNVAKPSILGATAEDTHSNDVDLYNGDNEESLSYRLSESHKDEYQPENGMIEGEKEEKARKNCYFKLTSYTTRYPYKCIVPLFIYCLMIPIIYQLRGYLPSIDFTMNFPREVESVNAYYVLIDKFNPGDMAPMYILVESKEGTVWSQHYFDALCAIGNKLIDVGYENNTQMISIGFIPNTQTEGIQCVTKNETIEKYKTLVNDPQALIGNYTHSKYYTTFMEWFNNTVNNPGQSVSYILATPNFNPYAGSALQNCENYRDAIHEVANRAQVKAYVDVYLHQSLYWEIDGLHETDKTMPWALALIIGIVFLLIGFVFKAIFLPFRLFLCIVVPIVFVYGCVTGVYQNGWFEWTQWHSLSKTDGIYWMLPVVTCTVLVGLALDYEIFLFSRVFEYRSKGYTTSASIILGVSTTGPIISAAGTVMAMAFGGLLLETITASNQMGLVFVFGVLVDTFIVRPLVVPAVLSFADKWNWYPTKMPVPTRDEFGKLLKL